MLDQIVYIVQITTNVITTDVSCLNISQ